jgi:thiol-disulfide isomerase/thioredoxin
VSDRISYSVSGTQYCVLVLFAATSITLGACQKPAVSSSVSALTSENVKLTQADGKSLDELIASHKGDVVFVDYWATWCLPCVQNFPHTVELAKKYRDKGLATIAVSFDLLDDEPKVREFLAKQGADFENLISKHDAIGQKPAEDFDVGPLPEYRLYDREGKRVQKWEGQAEEIGKLAAKIEELLAAKP